MPGRTVSARRRVLIVNAYFDYDRDRPKARQAQVAQAMAPAFLAGAFERRSCEVRLYNEQFSGPLADRELLGWPDMLVLTGVTNALDRMRQLAACVRTRNPSAVVVAGGPAVRALPRYSGQWFDYACVGDIEQMRDVVRDVFGSGAVAERMTPRFDLVSAPPGFGYVETSRNCNFACSFCALTGEGGRYQPYDAGYIEEQIRAGARHRYTFLLDNNLLGNDRASFNERVGVLERLHHEGVIRRWGALVTADFFIDEQRIERVKAAGCFGLFSGVESFDVATLRHFHKRQNLVEPQAASIERTLRAGVVFTYGLMADLYRRRTADVREEIESIIATPEITLPSFVTLPIPLLGTPYFRECAASGRLLPNIRLRDMEGSVLLMETLDSMAEAAEFVRMLQTFAGYRRKMAAHALRFIRRYRRALPLDGLFLATTGVGLLGLRALMTAPRSATRHAPGGGRPRTHVATTEHLDRVYTPPFRIDTRWQPNYEPLVVTDERGRVTDVVANEVLSRQSGQTPVAASV